MQARGISGGGKLSFFRRVVWLSALGMMVFGKAFSASGEGGATDAPQKILGMYVHQHWPYNHPYAARTWTVEDWRGYADGLHRLGYNALLIWPMLETMPDPLLPSDRANLKKIARVIDMLHKEFHMRAYIVLCPNVMAKNEEARKAPFERRHFFYSDRRVNPADAAAMQQMLDLRAKLLAPLAKMDGLAIIDSDPGGYPGSSNAEFVNLLMAHRKVLDGLRPGIELIYWLNAGWEAYARFYETGDMRTPATDAELREALALLKAQNPEPWGVANGLAQAKELGIADRVMSFNYGRIEGEPSFPMGNFGGDSAYEGGAAPGRPVTDSDYVEFANQLIPGLGEMIVRGWKNLAGTDAAAMHASVMELEHLSSRQLKPGPLKGLLFGSSWRFVNDLAMMLRVRAAFFDLGTAENQNQNVKAALDEFVTAIETWQHQHGYENSIGWGGLDETLRKLNSLEVNAVLDGRFNPFAPVKLLSGETPFQCVARELREEESCTPRLLKALEAAQKELK